MPWQGLNGTFLKYNEYCKRLSLFLQKRLMLVKGGTQHPQLKTNHPCPFQMPRNGKRICCIPVLHSLGGGSHPSIIFFSSGGRVNLVRIPDSMMNI